MAVRRRPKGHPDKRGWREVRRFSSSCLLRATSLTSGRVGRSWWSGTLLAVVIVAVAASACGGGSGGDRVSVEESDSGEDFALDNGEDFTDELIGEDADESPLGTVSPEMSLAEAEAKLAEAEAAEAVVAQTAQRFEDVPPDHYAFEAVEWAAEAGVTTGYGDGTFKPQRPLNKRHAVVFMERFYDEILQAEESKDFTRGDMMVLLKAINDADINDGASTGDGTLPGEGVNVIAAGASLPVIQGPLIYNDNLFVLPVSEDFVVDGVAISLPLEEYTKRFYEHFEDNFDFLFVASNLVDSPDILGASGYHISVKNDVQGIGVPLFSDTGMWGSPGRLQGVIGLPFVASFESEWTPIGRGPGVHEVMHRWANFLWPAGAHWGFSSANGILGGFDIALLEDHGSGRYTAGWFNTYGTVGLPFSPIELYLAGLAPLEEVPDLWVAEDGEWLLDSEGNRRLASNGYPLFGPSRKRGMKGCWHRLGSLWALRGNVG